MTNNFTKYGIMLIAAVLFIGVPFAGAVNAEPLLGAASGQDASQLILIKIDTGLLSISDIVDTGDIVYNYSTLLPGTYAVRIPPGYTQNEAVEHYEQIPGVIYAEADSTVYTMDTPVVLPTQQSPGPFAGIIAGLGIGSLILGFMKKHGGLQK